MGTPLRRPFPGVRGSVQMAPSPQGGQDGVSGRGCAGRYPLEWCHGNGGATPLAGWVTQPSFYWREKIQRYSQYTK